MAEEFFYDSNGNKCSAKIKKGTLEDCFEGEVVCCDNNGNLLYQGFGDFEGGSLVRGRINYYKNGIKEEEEEGIFKRHEDYTEREIILHGQGRRVSYHENGTILLEQSGDYNKGILIKGQILLYDARGNVLHTKIVKPKRRR